MVEVAKPVWSNVDTKPVFYKALGGDWKVANETQSVELAHAK
ncbi:transporter [Vibrio sp. F13]|nr:transporter [Vibrio sp. F13]TKG30548.1 transporter [Vibrio sp. F13]